MTEINIRSDSTRVNNPGVKRTAEPSVTVPQDGVDPGVRPDPALTLRQVALQAATPPSPTTLPDGLKFTDTVVGTGPSPQPGDRVTVHYTGTLTDGTKFDSSYDHPGQQPFQFKIGVGQVIKGWDEGVMSMKVGGERNLEIPPDLAYGNQDVGGGLIPANSTLLFNVKLLGVQSAG